MKAKFMFLLAGTMLAALMIAVSPVLATTYYVATDGDDGDAGTEAQPWATIQHAADTMTAGDTVKVQPGTYDISSGIVIDTSGTEGSPITYEANGEIGTVVLDGNAAAVDGFRAVDESWIVIKGFEIRNIHGHLKCGVQIRDSERITVQDCKIHDVYPDIIAGWTSAAAIKVVNCHDCTLKDNETYDCDRGVAVRRGNGASYHNLIEGNQAYNHTAHTEDSDGMACSDNANYGNIWRKNVIHNNADDGLDLWYSREMVVEGNLSYDNGLPPGGDGNGFKLGSKRDPQIYMGHHLVRYNVAYLNNRHGLNGNGRSHTYYNNTAYGNAYSGIADVLVDGETGSTLYNNISVGNSGPDLNSENPIAADYNCWGNTGDFEVYYNDHMYYSLSAYQAACGKESHSINQTPNFVDAANGDFHLQSNSPCIDAGKFITAGLSDRDDTPVPIGDAPDIGAYEWHHATNPNAYAGQDREVLVDVTITFDGSGSWDPNDDSLTYTWNLGDGTNSTACTVTHSYTATGVYTVTLTVDDGSNSDDDVCVITVNDNQAPTADAGSNQTIGIDEPITFDGSGSSDPDNDPLTYDWEFGDGGTASGCTVTHVYTASGTYTATLTVDDGFLTDSDTCVITVISNHTPVADAGSDQSVYAYEEVTFDGSGSSDADSDPLDFDWEFGDGESDFGMTVTHVYTATGTYTATLTVSDYELSDTDTCVITVSWGPPWSETADYYVDGVTGDDSNAGTSDEPLATITKAEDKANSAGDTVLVWGNQTYTGKITFQNSGSAGNPITFKRDPASSTCVIDGNGVASGAVYTNKADYIVIDGFKITNAQYGVYLEGDGADNWTVQNCRITGCIRNGIYFKQGDNHTAFNNLIYDNGSLWYGIYAYNNANDITISQCDVYNHKYGIYFYTNCSNAVVQDCIVTDNGTNGIRLKTGCTGTVTYSDVWNNGTDYYGCSAGTGCISSDPMFAAPAFENFYLDPDSPCIDAGSDSGDMGYRHSSQAL